MAIQWHQISALAWKNRLLLKRSSILLSLAKLFWCWLGLTPLPGIVLLFLLVTYETRVWSAFSVAFISMPCLILSQDIIFKIMLEKTEKIREHLRIQGVSETSHALSYLIHYLMVAVVASIWLFLVAFFAQVLKVAWVVFCILIATVAFAYALCAFFDNITLARFFALVTWCAAMIFVLAHLYMTFGSFSNTSEQFNFIRQGAMVMQYLHPAALWGYNFTDMNFSEELSFTSIAIIALCQAAVYFAAGIYLHQVIPSEHGRSRPWNFFFSKTGAESDTGATAHAITPDPTRFESTDTQRPAGIRFRNVVKEFDEGAVKAVNGVSLDIYRDEVFALLGHNGAGKTTLLECLVGLETPTSGCVVVDGRGSSSASSNNSIGYCPQFDAFYPNLEPIEVLELYSRLRGERTAEAVFNAETMLERLGLMRKAHNMASSLSGGQRRKLSVGLAFIGKVKTVVLDEPSSGLDLESSLELWSVIRNLQRDKTVVLTTHNMNEAEALGDRIGIMSVGSMQCLGTPMFLKSNLGSGYRISFRLAAGSDVESRVQVQALIKDQTPNATLISSTDSEELLFQIPNQDSHLIPGLLFKLESATSVPNLDSYHLTPTQLEDVFIRIAREHEDQVTSGVADLKPLPDFTPVPASSLTHIRSLLFLLGNHLRSDYGYWVSLVIPILFAFVSMVFNANHFDLGYLVLIIFTATGACNNLQRFALTDIRLQLDIFGIPWYTYAPVMIVFNLLQIGVPFSLYQVCFMYSGHEVPLEFSSFSVIMGFVFMMVGFMAIIRSCSAKIGGWNVVVFPSFIYGTIVYISVAAGRPAVLNYVLEAFQLHPVFLFNHRSINSTPLTDQNLLLANLVLGVIYFIGAIALDFRSLHPNRFSFAKTALSSPPEGPVDEDVEFEAKRLRSGSTSDILQVVDLTKSHGKVAAVRGISVGVAGGQSLAFLGVNGSGKSSSIRCMLGISSVTDGEIRVAGVDVLKDEFGARQNIGYVPQHDHILIGRMTGRQQLKFVAQLAGVPERIQSELIDTMLTNIGLNESSAKRRIDTYSGGMKRKLCVALALLMKRKIVLLDEPSTGVDPVSRRRFWSMFADVQADSERCLLLTTHQLDEAEAVCDRISIMVNGRIVCVGSAAHLKQKFGNHYQIDLSCRSRDEIGIVRQWLTTKYPRASLVEADGVHLRYWLRKTDCNSFAELFAFVSDHGDVPVQECLVGHATLDQIFISLAHKAKRNPDAHYIQVMQSFD